jgi:TetR/AcrR family transcriptional regulator
MAPRDPEATKSRLLAAALQEFAEKGIAGARVDVIAERAKTNKRMLYYYFGSKEGIYREILRQRLLSTTETLRNTDVADPGRLAVRHDRLLDSPQYVRLLMWEALEPDAAAPLEDEPSRQALYRSWVDTIEVEQRAGRLPADLDAAQMLLSEMALIMFPVAFPQLTRLITGSGPEDAEYAKRRREFLEALGRRLLATED